MGVLVKKDQPLLHVVRNSFGFDYPANLVGTSNWRGADGKGVQVYYDPVTGTAGLTAAKYVLAHIDDVMAACDQWFGKRGLGGNVLVVKDVGGAYHYGCSFGAQGGDWYCSVGNQETVLGLAMAEISESYMGGSAGWNCGGSGGEALSRVMAEIVSGGPTGALKDYQSASSWDGTDWISKDQGTDRDYPSIGCGVLYLYYMLSLGFTLAQIVQAGEPDGSLASNYAVLTGKSKALAYNALLQGAKTAGPLGSYHTDNPFNATLPTYPVGGSVPTPPPPVPPPPPPPVATYPTPAQWDAFLVTLLATYPRYRAYLQPAKTVGDDYFKHHPAHEDPTAPPVIDQVTERIAMRPELADSALPGGGLLPIILQIIQSLLGGLGTCNPTPAKAHARITRPGPIERRALKRTIRRTVDNPALWEPLYEAYLATAPTITLQEVTAMLAG